MFDNHIQTLLSHRPASHFEHHNQQCCQAGQAWVWGVHLAYSNGDPLSISWIRRRYPWAPTSWPVFWCELPNLEGGDCGVHAALAETCISASDVPVRRAQMLLRFGFEESEHWAAMWNREGVVPDWISADVCYHEVVAVGDRYVRLLDPGDNVEWVSPHMPSVLAVRILGGKGESYVWGDREFATGLWYGC